MLRSEAIHYASDTSPSSGVIARHHDGAQRLLLNSCHRKTAILRPKFPCAVGLEFRGRNVIHAVCFKDDVSSRSSDAFNVKDVGSLVTPSDASISCTTFNILAPIYKRLNGKGLRESEVRDSWLARNQEIIELLLHCSSSVICLQEVWLGSHELTKLYDDNLTRADYITYKLARPNRRGDGLFTAIRGEELKVLSHEDLLFNDCGDRVAQLFHLCTKLSGSRPNPDIATELELILVNTHLLFPHDFNYCLVRLRQVHKILKCIDQFKREHYLTTVPVILCGDWNGSRAGRVYKFLCSQGYTSSYEAVHDNADKDSQLWISHKNHRGNVCKVDFIWLLHPDTHQKPLLESWNEAVFGTIKAKLSQVGLEGENAFRFFQCGSKSNFLTLEEFQQGLQQLGLTEALSDECSEGLTRKEVDQLMKVIDINGNGVIDYNEFEALLSEDSPPVSSRESILQLLDASRDTVRSSVVSHSQSQRLSKDGETSLQDRCSKLRKSQSYNVKDAFLLPREVEAGVWPDGYSLSDHAALTVTFSFPRNVGSEHPCS